MLEDNPFADLIPGNQPATGGLGYRPPRAAKPEIRQVGDTLGIVDPTTGSFTPTYTKPGGSEDNSPEAVKLREGESNAAYLVTNMLTGVNSLTNAIKTDPSAAYPTMGQEIAGMFGQTARNFSQPAQRQIAYGSQRTVVDAMLTLATGLTYTEEQIDAYTRGYFPQLGDEPATIADKRNKLKAAMVAARIKAGKAAPKIDEAMAALGLDAAGGFDKLGDTSDLPGFEGALPSTPASMGADGRTSAKLDLTDLGGNPRPGQVPNVVETAEEDDWPIGAVHGDWKRVDDHTIQNTRTGERSTYTGLTVVGGGDAARQREAEARARAEAYRAKQERFNPLDPRETMLVHGMSGTLSDEAAGVGGFLKNALTLQNPIEGYTTVRDAERLRIEDARRQLGGWGTALEVGGGFLSLNPEAATAPVANALAAFTKGAKAGGAGGAIYGFGSGEGAEESLGNAAAGAGIGALAGGALGAAATRMGGGGPDPAILNAVREEQIAVPNLMVSPTRSAINKAGRLEADPAAAPVIQRAFEETNEAIGGKVSALGQGGQAKERADAGEMVRQAAKDIKEADKRAASAAYDAAEAIDGDPAIALDAMKTKLDDEIARLQRTPGQNAETIRELKKYRKDIDGPLPLSAVRDMRTNLRDNVSGDLTRSSAKKRADKRMMSVLEGTNEDLQKGLSPEAWKAWQEADALYAGQMKFVKEALIPFVGKDFDQLPAEAIFDRLKAAANSNGRALATLHRRLSPDQSRDIAATFAESLGKAGPDDPFSTARFITQARKLSNSARQTIFGPSGADSFNNLLRLSRRLEQVKGEINRSKTARPVIAAVRQRMNVIIGTVLTGGGAIAGGPVGGGAGLVAAGALAAGSGISRALSAKALMNPRVSKLLLDGLDVDSVWKMDRFVQRLRVLSEREPALTAELEPIREALSKQILPSRLAASDTETEQ